MSGMLQLKKELLIVSFICYISYKFRFQTPMVLQQSIFSLGGGGGEIAEKSEGVGFLFCQSYLRFGSLGGLGVPGSYVR